MKTGLKTLLVLILLLFAVPGYSADPPPSAPRMINLQAVLLDDGGNVVTDKQEADIVFSVVDIEGETLYEEVQHVPIVYGAISVLVGRGKDVASGMLTGGIPMEALIPDGTRLLRIKLNEQSIPQEDLQLVSVPYALYAERMSHPIESDEILDGTLAQADLSAELLSFITDSISGTSATALTAHRTEPGAHPARSISVENTFTHASGTDLQRVLQGLDTAIVSRRNQEGEIIEDVDDEIAARAAADTAEATTRAAGDDEVRASEISRAGDTIYGDLSFYADDTLATQTMSIAPSTGDITTQGQVSALAGMFTIELDPVSSEPIISIDNTGGVETYRFEAETGSLTLRGDLTIADADILMSPGRLVDGVDISALDASVTNIINRLPPGQIPLDDIYVNVTGDTMTGPLTATAFTGDGSNLTALNGTNITTGTVADGRIASSIARDSEVSAAVADHADDTTAVHGVGAGSTIVGTNEEQTLIRKTLGTTHFTTGSDLIFDGGESVINFSGNDSDIIFGGNNSDIVFTGTGTVDGLEVGSHNHDPSTPNMGAQIAHSHLSGLGADDHTQYFESDGSDSMLGNMTMADPAECTATAGDGVFQNDPDCLRVDNIDVSELEDRVTDLETTDLNQPTILAWGRVTLDGPNDNTPNIVGFHVSSVDAGDINGSFEFVDTTNQGTYRVNLSQAISGSYVVTGNVAYTDVGNPRGPLVVISQSASSFVVRTMSTASDPDGDVGFNFSIIGGP